MTALLRLGARSCPGAVLVVLCACGCPRGVHRHYSRATYCGRHGDCQRWRPKIRRVRLTSEDLRLLAADPRRTP